MKLYIDSKSIFFCFCFIPSLRALEEEKTIQQYSEEQNEMWNEYAVWNLAQNIH